MRLVKLKGVGRINGLHYTPDGRRLLAVGGSSDSRHDMARWVDVGDAREPLRQPLAASHYAVSSDLSRMAAGGAFGADVAS